MTHPAIRLSIAIALTALLVAPGCKKAQDAAVERAIERATGATLLAAGAVVATWAAIRSLRWRRGRPRT